MVQRELNTWTVVQMYCPNCGTLSTGYCALNHKNLFIECNTCYEAPLHRIFPEDIVYVEEVLDGAKVSYQREDLICK